MNYTFKTYADLLEMGESTLKNLSNLAEAPKRYEDKTEEEIN
jgi:hypothetical protein